MARLSLQIVRKLLQGTLHAIAQIYDRAKIEGLNV